ncbi:hypothetical protein FK216_12005 [Moraxellaceae bacterium AER2_44_116]|nr:hypothetical protein FK216_12005 [Moraxellaceae bacterium AER2_44_116]
MSVIISPVITNAGLSVFTPSATGIEFTFTHVAVGTGTSAASSADTALEHEIARFPIAGGGMVTGGRSASINVLVTNHQNANPQNYDITEVGFYGLDGANNTILFAIYRQNAAIISKVSGGDISAPFVMGLAALPVNNMTVQIDANTNAMLALLGQHTASNHPHTQYKRTLDNSERLKIAAGVEVDDAVSKGQLEAEATTRAGVDSALAGQIAQEVLDRQAGDSSLSQAINSEATTRAGVDSALAGQIAQEALDRQAGDNNLQTQINNLTLQIMSKTWPIGSVYENEVDMRNPAHADLLGFGTWIPTQYGRFSVGYADTDPQFGGLGWAGGNRNHKMTLANLIEHDHDYTDRTELDYAASNSVGLGTDHKDRVLKTGKAGSADPDPIPTLPPYVVSAKWRRTA